MLETNNDKLEKMNCFQFVISIVKIESLVVHLIFLILQILWFKYQSSNMRTIERQNKQQ